MDFWISTVLRYKKKRRAYVPPKNIPKCSYAYAKPRCCCSALRSFLFPISVLFIILFCVVVATNGNKSACLYWYSFVPYQCQCKHKTSAQVQGCYSYRFSQKCLSRFRFPIQNHLDFVDAFARFVSYCFFRSHSIPILYSRQSSV